MRSKYTNKNLHLDISRINYINGKIPEFIWNYKNDTFTKKVDELRDFRDTHEFWPRRVHKEASDQEKMLGKFVSRIRESYNNPDIENIPYKLTEDRLSYLAEHIPDFAF
jgi:hypothetical protein